MELLDRTHTICLSCSGGLFPFNQFADNADVNSCVNGEPDSLLTDVNDTLSINNDKFPKLYEDILENRPLLQNEDFDTDEH